MGGPTTWTTKDGQKLSIVDMSDSHLMNTIRLIERAYAAGLNIYCSGIGPQGDAATDAFNAEYDAYLEDGPAAVRPEYEPMCEEAIRRGLTNDEERLNERTALDVAALDMLPTAPGRTP